MYRAPSWSWASTDGIVSYLSYGATKRYPDYSAKIIGCQTELATEDPYGTVNSGTLVIRGRARTVSGLRNPEGGCCEAYVGDGEGSGTLSVGSVCLDDDDNDTIASTAGTTMHCLLIHAIHGPQKAGFCHSLLLAPQADSRGRYERVGLLLSDSDIWEGCAERTFTIV